MTHTDNDYKVFLYISTIIAGITPVSRPVSALRKHLRKMMAAKNIKGYEKTLKIAKEANELWIQVQEDHSKEIRVTTIASLNSLYKLMTKDQKLIPEKKFEAAIRSIHEMSKHNDNPQEIDNNNNAKTISDALAKGLGIKVDNSLSRLKNKIRNELILEGKIT